MKEFSRVVVETLVIAGIGCGIGVTANTMRTRNGIELNRNYWPTLTTGLPPRTPLTPTTTQAATTSREAAVEPPTPNVDNDPMQQVIAQLRSQGLQEIRHKEVAALYNDPLYPSGAYVFIDARNDEHFAESHVPGAHHLAKFWSAAEQDRVIQELDPLLRNAVKIVVYCGGGECEDSAGVAMDLIQHGVDPSKVYVDIDGFTAWTAAGMKTEAGEAKR